MIVEEDVGDYVDCSPVSNIKTLPAPFFGSAGSAGGSAHTMNVFGSDNSGTGAHGIAGGGGSGLSNPIPAASLVQVSIPDFASHFGDAPTPEVLSLVQVLDNFLNVSNMREKGIPTAEDVFANKTSFDLVQFFNRNRINYYIILNGGSVLTSLEFPFEGVMRVYCDNKDHPYLSVHHKTIEDLIKDQEL